MDLPGTSKQDWDAMTLSIETKLGVDNNHRAWCISFNKALHAARKLRTLHSRGFNFDTNSDVSALHDEVYFGSVLRAPKGDLIEQVRALQELSKNVVFPQRTDVTAIVDGRKATEQAIAQ